MKTFQLIAVTILVCMCILITSSCSRNKTEILPLTTWDCTDLSTSDTLYYTSLFDFSDLLGLEECKESCIGRIDKIITHDSIMYVLDTSLSKQIIAFNSYGKFLFSIGRLGRSSDEYLSIQDFSLDDKTGDVYLLCNKNKVLQFNAHGTYIGKRDLPFRVLNLEYTGNHFFLIREDGHDGELVITDDNLNVIYTSFPNSETALYYQLLHPLQKREDGGVTYLRYLDNNIYRISTHGECEILYQVNFGADEINRETVKGYSHEEIKQKLSRGRGYIKLFTENYNYACILFFDRNIPYLSLYNKTTGKIFTYPVNRIQDFYNVQVANPIEYAFANKFVVVLPNDNAISEKMDTTKLNIGNNPLINYLY